MLCALPLPWIVDANCHIQSCRVRAKCIAPVVTESCHAITTYGNHVRSNTEKGSPETQTASVIADAFSSPQETQGFQTRKGTGTIQSRRTHMMGVSLRTNETPNNKLMHPSCRLAGFEVNIARGNRVIMNVIWLVRRRGVW